MNRELLTQAEQLKALRARLDAIAADPLASPADRELLLHAVAQSAGLVEELQRAEAEIRRQREDLRRAHAAARAERHRYAELFDSAAEAYLVTDHAGVLRETNAAAARFLNLPAESLVGRPLADLLPPEEHSALRARLDALSRGLPLHDWAVVLRPPHGCGCEASLAATPVPADEEGAAAARWVLRRRSPFGFGPAATPADEGDRRFETLADAAPVMIWVACDAARRPFLNRVWLEFTGRPMTSDLGERWVTSLHPDDLEFSLRQCRESFEARRPFRVEYRLRRHDGRYRWVLDCGTPRYAPDGRFAGYVGSCTDVTELRESEEASRRAAAELEAKVAERTAQVQAVNAALGVEVSERRRSERLLAEAQQLAHMGSWEWDIPANVVTWSDELYRIFGFEPGAIQVTYESFLQLIHPEDRDVVERGVQHAFETATPFRFDHRIVTPQGRVRVVEGRGEVTVGPDGRPVRMFGTAHDVTERIEVERALRDSEERFRLLVEGLVDYAIYQLDPDGRIVSWNSGAERIFGFRGDEIIGRNFACFFPEEQVAEGRPVTELALTLAEGRFENEGWRVRKDGSRFWANFIITPLHAVGGQLRGFAKITRDITQRKEAEDKIQRLNDELVRRLLDLSVSNRELEAFSYSVSHDLRAPLRAIHGFCTILAEEYSGRLDGEGRRLLEVVRRSTERMGSLIDDLLAFSRLGRQEMTLGEVDLAGTALAVFEELAPLYGARQVEFAVHPLPAPRGDAAMLRQVLHNLLSNALKFTLSEGPARIEIGGWEGDGERIYFVRDNGVGFDMRYASKLFEVFQRLHAAHQFEGTGVGLAIVQRIVQRHGGRVWAEGEVGKGATFYFTLPVPRR